MNKSKSFKYDGTLEYLMSDFDDIREQYTLFVNIDGHCHIYEPEDLDYVEPDLLEKEVDFFVKHTDNKHVLFDVYLKTQE